MRLGSPPVARRIVQLLRRALTAHIIWATQPPRMPRLWTMPINRQAVSMQTRLLLCKRLRLLLPRVCNTLNINPDYFCRGAGIDAAEDAARGWDHGVFVPLKLAFPAAALPVVELSVLSSLDPEARTYDPTLLIGFC